MRGASNFYLVFMNDFGIHLPVTSPTFYAELDYKVTSSSWQRKP